jgi:hypothetical protein
MQHSDNGKVDLRSCLGTGGRVASQVRHLPRAHGPTGGSSAQTIGSPWAIESAQSAHEGPDSYAERGRHDELVEDTYTDPGAIFDIMAIHGHPPSSHRPITTAVPLNDADVK